MKKEKIDREYFQSLSKELFEKLSGEENLSLSLQGESSNFVRFNNTKVRQAGTVDDASLSMELIVQQSGEIRRTSHAISLCGDADQDRTQVSTTLAGLQKECRELPVDPLTTLPANPTTSFSSVEGESLPLEEIVPTLCEATKGNDFTGLYAAGSLTRANANSLGHDHWFATNNYLLDYSLYGANESAYKGTFAGNQWSTSDFEKEISQAKQKLTALAQPSMKVKKGSYRTYLAPGAVHELLGMICYITGEARIRQGESPLQLMVRGEKSFSPLVTLTQDFSTGFVPRFNDRGELAPEKLTIFDKGVLKNTLINSRSAKEYNLASNGADESEGLRAPCMAAGTLSEDDALKELGTGLYLSNLHYLNFSDLPKGRVTGMTRFACFWVEDGKIKAPIENLRWDDTLFNLFGENLEALTQEIKDFPSTESYYFRSLGGMRCPGMLLKSMEFTL